MVLALSLTRWLGRSQLLQRLATVCTFPSLSLHADATHLIFSWMLFPTLGGRQTPTPTLRVGSSGMDHFLKGVRSGMLETITWGAITSGVIPLFSRVCQTVQYIPFRQEGNIATRKVGDRFWNRYQTLMRCLSTRSQPHYQA